MAPSLVSILSVMIIVFLSFFYFFYIRHSFNFVLCVQHTVIVMALELYNVFTHRIV